MQMPLIKISPVNMDQRAQLGIHPGDTVRVWQKIKEKDKTRLQVFEGLVLAHKHGNEPGATFTVRKIASGVGVEKIFPLYSPMIDKIEIVKRAKVRRAKLYYIREKAAREIRRQMRKIQFVDITTKNDTEEKAKDTFGASPLGDGAPGKPDHSPENDLGKEKEEAKEATVADKQEKKEVISESGEEDSTAATKKENQQDNKKD